jgi:hypothetical protein
MILYTSHINSGNRGRRETPILVREGFSWPAALFGALYLAAHRAFLAAGINLAAFLVAVGIARLLHTSAPLWGAFALQGLLCPDLLRWNLAKRGYQAGPPIAAPDPEAALVRLLDARPDFLPTMPPGARAT